MSLWNNPVPVLDRKPINTGISAEQTALKTALALESKGHCRWQCKALNNEVITVVTNDQGTDPRGDYPVYSTRELKLINDNELADTTIQLIHEAKKYGATICSVVTSYDKQE